MRLDVRILKGCTAILNNVNFELFSLNLWYTKFIYSYLTNNRVNRQGPLKDEGFLRN